MMRFGVGWEVYKAFGTQPEGTKESLQSKCVSMFVVLQVIWVVEGGDV